MIVLEFGEKEKKSHLRNGQESKFLEITTFVNYSDQECRTPVSSRTGPSETKSV